MLPRPRLLAAFSSAAFARAALSASACAARSNFCPTAAGLPPTDGIEGRVVCVDVTSMGVDCAVVDVDEGRFRAVAVAGDVLKKDRAALVACALGEKNQALVAKCETAARAVIKRALSMVSKEALEAPTHYLVRGEATLAEAEAAERGHDHDIYGLTIQRAPAADAGHAHDGGDEHSHHCHGGDCHAHHAHGDASQCASPPHVAAARKLRMSAATAPSLCEPSMKSTSHDGSIPARTRWPSSGTVFAESPSMKVKRSGCTVRRNSEFCAVCLP